MRIIGPAVTIIFSLAAFILSFICIFAGHRPGVLENYPIIAVSLLCNFELFH